MKDPKPEKVLQADVLEQMLPLVLEIIPGQANEAGLVRQNNNFFLVEFDYNF